MVAELTPPANPMLDDRALLRISYEMVTSAFKAKDPALEQDAPGAVSHTVGVG